MIRIVKRSLPALLVACAGVALIGCESDGSEEPTTQAAVSMGAVNDTCPIMGGDVDPNAKMAEFEGAKIGFCCDGCISKWNTWSYAQKQDFVTKNQ